MLVLKKLLVNDLIRNCVWKCFKHFVLEHINYIVDQIGHDCVGIGSDFDGIDR